MRFHLISQIYINASKYYALDKESINLGIYEVQFDYFPVMMKPDFQPPTNDSEWVQTIHWDPTSIDLCGYASHVDNVLTWSLYNANAMWGVIQEALERRLEAKSSAARQATKSSQETALHPSILYHVSNRLFGR